MRRLAIWLVLACACGVTQAQRSGGNLAGAAKVSASSEFSDDYRAGNVIDGKVPARLGHADLKQAWCVRKAQSGDRGELAFRWEKPVRVGAVVYYGRTSWEMAECWRDFEVYADGDEKPLHKGRFEQKHGPQVVEFVPREMATLRIKFLNSYGGSNPGAAEVQLFAQKPAKGELIACDPWGEFAESPHLKEQIARGELGFDKVVFIKRHELKPSHVYTAHCEGFRGGGGLYVLSPPGPNGKLTELLASPDGQMLSLDVSWDGKRILLSWKKSAADTYHLYELNADGSGLKQLTTGDWHDYYGVYLPDGGIAFITTREPKGPLCFHTPSGVLFRMDADGKNVRKLSASYVDDFTPAVMNDGRILYTRWEYVDRPAIPIQSLWTMYPDGSNLRVYYGNRVLSPASFLQAKAIPGTGKVLATLTAHNGPVRGGVGMLDPSFGNNAQEAIANLTPEVRIGDVGKGDGNNVRGPYEGPTPIDEKRYLVSRAGKLMLGEYAGGMATLYGEDGDIGCYNPMVLGGRTKPPVLTDEGRDAREAEKVEWASVYLLDVYQGLAGIERGSVKALRVVEEVGKPYAGGSSAFGFQTPVISCGATYAVKRVWGTVQVSEDGSTYFNVPANRPVYFIALDKDGVAMQRMRTFTQLRAGETQGCVGCHEPRETAPARTRLATALAQKPQSPTAPSWGVRGFDYARHVQPVLDAKCVSCHAGIKPAAGVDLSGDKTEWFSASYDTLTRKYVNWIPTHNGAEANILQISPNAWGSPKSALTKVILGKHPESEPAKAVTLNADERARLLTWIDLNVPYYGTYAASDGLKGGRQLHPPELKAKLSQVWAGRCAGCHGEKVRDTGYVRIENPKLNAFLAAPLAAKAGGRGACGEVFKSTDDPDYRALLEVMEKFAPHVKDARRSDFPNGKTDEACEVK